jgi:hypothetical protein
MQTTNDSDGRMARSRYAMAMLLVALAVRVDAQPAPQGGTPSNAPALTPVITLTGEMRTRSEWDRPGGGIATDVFTLLRSRLGVRVDAAQRVRLVAQVQDSRVLGAEGTPAAATAGSFGLHQGYVELYAPWRRSDVVIRAGRQEVALGNERLVGVVNWSNVGRSFDGARVTFTPSGGAPGTESWSVSGFAATVEERGRHFGGTVANPAPDHIVLGLFASRPVSRGTVAELTLLADEAGRYRGYVNANRTTVHGRVRSPRLAALSLDIEGALQVGHQVDSSAAGLGRRQPVRAWMMGARVGTPTKNATRGTLVVGVDVLSGDDSAHDERYSTFNTLYASNHAFYGLMDVIGEPAASTRERGLTDALAVASWRVSGSLRPRAELHRFALASGRDRPLGWEGDVVLPFRLSPAATMDIGYGAFRADRGAPTIGLGAKSTTKSWAYLSLRAGF